MTLAPWLKAPDLAQDWLRGVALGQQAAESSQRLAAERERTAMEAQARSETLQRENLEQQQRVAVQKAYQDAQIGLRQQQLQQIAQRNAQQTQAAAMKLHQQTIFNKTYQETGDVQKALFASGLGTPQNVLAARKDVEDLGAQRLNQRQEALELREKEYADKASKKPVPRRIGEKTVTDPITGDKTTSYQFDQSGAPAGVAAADQPDENTDDMADTSPVPTQPAPASTQAPVKYDSPAAVRAAYKSGVLKRDDAAKILQEQFKYE